MHCDIVIVTDFEEGHVFPLFRVARNLEKNGYKVCFVGVPDTMEIVRKNGFNHYTILEDLFPKGYVWKMKQKGMKTNSISMKYYLESFVNELDTLISALNPKLVFSSFFFVLEALIIYYRYQIPQVIFHTLLPDLDSDSSISLGQRSYFAFIKKVISLDKEIHDYLTHLFHSQGHKFEDFEKTAIPLKDMHQVLLCPKELDIHNSSLNDKDIYLGPCINLRRNDNQKNFIADLRARTDKPLIYASMGSQIKEYPEKARTFFNSMLKSMESRSLQGFHLVLSLGSSNSLNLIEAPENATIFNWVPQLEVLQNAKLAIIHGGLGSLKECIYFGVPMLAVPMGRDQMDNAQRIEHHQIGGALSLTEVNHSTLANSVQSILNNKRVKGNLLKMKMLFRKVEKKEREVMLVSKLIKL